MTKKVKLSDVARDLQISTQELIGFYQERDANGNTKKGVTGLTPEEINLALEYYSQKSQVESLDAYFASKDTPKQKQEKKPSEKKPAEKKPAEKKPAEEPDELTLAVEKVLTDQTIVPQVVKFIRQYKTKQGINNALNKEFKDSKRTSEIYSAIKPLIADKKGK